MRSWLRTSILLGAVVAGTAGTSAQADPTDAGAARAVIEGQIAAFARDDGAQAFDFAAPGVRELFVDPDGFMRMVRQGYQPVYRPRDVMFGELSEAGSTLVQKVYVTGPDGLEYLATYTLERQLDGTLKIAGCSLARVGGGRA